MDFVEYHEFDISNKISPFVQHTTQNLSGHYKTSGFWIDLNIPCQDSNGRRGERLLEVPKFLIRKGLDWRCVDGSSNKR